MRHYKSNHDLLFCQERITTYQLLFPTADLFSSVLENIMIINKYMMMMIMSVSIVSQYTKIVTERKSFIRPIKVRKGRLRVKVRVKPSLILNLRSNHTLIWGIERIR
jgi:hypothetical protein